MWKFCSRHADCAEAALHLLQLLAHLAVELAGPWLNEYFFFLQAGGSADQVHGAQLKKNSPACCGINENPQPEHDSCCINVLQEVFGRVCACVGSVEAMLPSSPCVKKHNKSPTERRDD